MNIKELLSVLPKLVKYNLKIIFAGKFMWFLLAAFIFLMIFMVQAVLSNKVLSEGFIYEILFMPGLLLIFYPSVFGIQNDEDNKILEIIFGIPNYRYKVWLLRLVIIYLAIALILVMFGYAAKYLLYPVNPFEIVARLMLPVMFVGNMAFMLSTLVRSGNGTAVVVILLAIAFMFFSSSLGLDNSMWDVTLNPFDMPQNIHPLIWGNIVFKNTLFLAIGGLALLMIGLLNLQKREKFV
ncbi:MAG: hypothetical protein LUF90_02540 [Rikenellaceae bacterium]|nr:hypothetical protein [Rikenellaceae bacterium]